MTHVLKLWLHTLPKHSSVHTVLHVYISCRTHTDTRPNHALTHADKITDAEAPYSQRVKRAGSVHLHSCGLHICLFFPWRCTTRPWRAMKVMLVVQRWKCVTGGRLRGPAWNLQSPHRVQDRGPAQEQQRRGEGKRPLETHCPSTRCFTQILFHSQTCVAFSGQPAKKF